jgi:hypothetical protein
MSQSADLFSTTINKTGYSEQETPSFNFDKSVRSPSGSLELNQYLYDSGLQNVFKDYEENIASLDKSKQTQLQDAYYVRELSKKYLGEYASNEGIGDVSGNLLDIYGKYQQNKQAITQNHDALKLNLTQEYRKEKTALFNEKMKEQYNMELADFAEGSQEIMFNAVTGGYDTELYADEWEYLDAMKESGDLSTGDYQMAYGTMYSSMIDRIQTNVTNGNFEGFDNAQDYIDSFGKLTAGDKSMLQGVASNIDKENRITDITNNLNTGNYGEGVEGMDYLDSVRSIIGEQAYQQHYGRIYADIYQKAFSGEGFDPETMTIDEYVNQFGDLSSTDKADLKKTMQTYVDAYNNAKIDTTIGNLQSENYVGADYNFNANSGGENVGAGSYMYQDANGVKSFSVLDDSEADEAVSGWFASHKELTEAFGGTPKTGDEVQFTAVRDKEDGSSDYQQFTYVFQNGRWHRMVQENILDKTDMAQWYFEGGSGKTHEFTKGEGWTYDDGYIKPKNIFQKHKDGADTFTYGSVKYTQSDSVYNGSDLSAVQQLFTDTHGSRDNAVVYHNNKFYVRKAGQIYEMTK